MWRKCGLVILWRRHFGHPLRCHQRDCHQRKREYCKNSLHRFPREVLNSFVRESASWTDFVRRITSTSPTEHKNDSAIQYGKSRTKVHRGCASVPLTTVIEHRLAPNQ